MQHIERQILERLRNQRFFSLEELNEIIFVLLRQINSKPFQKLPGSRLTQFEKLDKPVLKPLPNIPYEFAEWKKAKPGPDYHIELDRHYYSVPYTFIGKELEVRFTVSTVEVFYHSKRISSHKRKYKHGHTTVFEHMPTKHQKYAEWTPERIINWAKKLGMATGEFIEKVIDSKVCKQQAFRSCLGIIRLGKSYGEQRLEAACKRGLAIGACSYKSIESILKNNLDQLPVEDSEKLTLPDTHENVRGGDYFV